MPRNTDSVILQLYVRTPAPCRDYCGLTVTKTDLVLNIWNITYGPHVYPKRHKCLIEDFDCDKHFQNEIRRLFGNAAHEYAMKICKNEAALDNFPEKIFLQILRYLATKDIRNLTQTSKIMFERCNTDNVWKILFRKYFKKVPRRQDLVVADHLGWKETLKQKIKTIDNTKIAGQGDVTKNKNKNQREISKSQTNLSSTLKVNNNVRSAKTNNTSLTNIQNAATTKSSCNLITSNKPSVSNCSKGTQSKSKGDLKTCMQVHHIKSMPSMQTSLKSQIKLQIPQVLETSAAMNKTICRKPLEKSQKLGTKLSAEKKSKSGTKKILP